MNSIEKLSEIFSHFPGIGQRQAKRFVYYLLTRNSGVIEDLAKSILELKKDINICEKCNRFFEKRYAEAKLCKICSDPNRDESLIMLVPRDIDLESVEKSGIYNGYYFVLGGTVPILEKEPEKRIRINEVRNFLKTKLETGLLKEIIIAVNINPEGENTAQFISENIKDILGNKLENKEIKISTLGKGLSTGTELEYTDPDTMKNAFKNRG